MQSLEYRKKGTLDGSSGKNGALHVSVVSEKADTGALLVAGIAADVDPKEALRVRRKIDWHIMPLMCTIYWVQYMDKLTLGNAAILGLKADIHLTTNEYNWLGTIFYISYLIFEYPQNLALQRLPVGKWLSVNIFVWGTAMCCHAACKDFRGLFACRFVLGLCEGSITAGFMVVTSMFYTRTEQTLRVGYWFMMNGTAQIILGLVSFGSLHTHTKNFHPWQWLVVITGAITLSTACAFWIMFPDSPTNAWFLTHEERIIAVQRLKTNQTGVENKHFKKEQFYEALTDLKTWLFFLFSALDNVPNSLTNQTQIIMDSFGFTNEETTLFALVSGTIELITISSGVQLASRLKDARAYVGFCWYLPTLLGILLVNLLPWTDKVGLLCGQELTNINVTAFVLSLSWLTNVTAGHTKKVTSNAIMLIGYCVGNSAGPFIWQAQYEPRNHVPWAVIGICYVCCMFILLIIRFLLARENRRRDMEERDTTYDDVYIEVLLPDGTHVEKKVEKEYLDLTDKQNRDFRYAL
ncbi:MFS general substrate transporter [Laetiporus sulphureus 93-53]|uniref:MFS general substrate transporter n=1 Tax=Laetiporus sulphureus 93-53 TaxID=1314785 RepID=A0A165CPQ0_9APHY|nr:MFS general substrate transporter [Laetiporus sulphureus 93-53]KZT03194.1 MFS general substrate transporter [Laetiporus sulphureus 93-53]